MIIVTPGQPYADESVSGQALAGLRRVLLPRDCAGGWTGATASPRAARAHRASVTRALTICRRSQSSCHRTSDRIGCLCYPYPHRHHRITGIIRPRVRAHRHVRTGRQSCAADSRGRAHCCPGSRRRETCGSRPAVPVPQPMGAVRGTGRRRAGSLGRCALSRRCWRFAGCERPVVVVKLDDSGG